MLDRSSPRQYVAFTMENRSALCSGIKHKEIRSFHLSSIVISCRMVCSQAFSKSGWLALGVGLKAGGWAEIGYLVEACGGLPFVSSTFCPKDTIAIPHQPAAFARHACISITLTSQSEEEKTLLHRTHKKSNIYWLPLNASQVLDKRRGERVLHLFEF